MNKLIKIAGVWIAAELVFALGKGHMLTNVRRFNPEVGDEIREHLENRVFAEGTKFRHSVSGVVICKADDFMTRLYNKEDQKKRERG